MAEEKQIAAKEKKVSANKEPESKGAKFINWCKKLPGRIATPFQNMWHELKKVSWPTKEKLTTYSIVVLVFMVVVMVVIGLLDMGASALVRLLV